MSLQLDNKLLKQFGAYLASRRRLAKYSQGDVARLLNFKSAQSVSNLERGIGFPPVYVLKAMVELYKIPEREILDIVTQMTREHWKKSLEIKDSFGDIVSLSTKKNKDAHS